MSRQLATSTSTVTVIIVAAIFCWVLHTFYLIATVTVLPPNVLADIPSKKEIGSTSTIIKTETEPTKQNLANVPQNKKHIKHTSIINNTESLYIITTNGEENPSKSKKKLHLRLHINRLSRINPLYAQSPSIFETNRKRHPLP